MGYIKEPAGIDFVVDPTPITAADRKRISEIIAHYKATGKKMPLPIVKIDKSLDKFDDKILFPEKLKKANEMLKKIGLPKQWTTK